MDDNPNATPELQERSGVGRRTVLTAAWSVPAISVLAAAPAMAASPPVPIVASVLLIGTRGSSSTKKDVSFTWSISSSVAITSVSISADRPVGFPIGTVTAPTSLNGSGSATFTGSNHDASSTSVPSFVLTVSFIHSGVSKSATFAVNGLTVGEGSTQAFTVTADKNNPKA